MIDASASDWEGAGASWVVVLECTIVPMIAVVVYAVAQLAFVHLRVRARFVSVSAWCVTFGFWELAALFERACGQFADMTIVQLLGYEAVAFLVLTRMVYNIEEEADPDGGACGP